MNNLAPTNTFFPKSPERTLTWYSADGHTKRTYDYILTRRSHLSTVQDVTAVPKGESHFPPWSFDHRLVIATLRLRLSRSWAARRAPRPPSAFHLDAFKCREVQAEFAAAVARRLPHLSTLAADEVANPTCPLSSPEDED